MMFRNKASKLASGSGAGAPQPKKAKQGAQENSMLCAASVLPNSTEVLARRHRRSHALVETQLHKKTPVSNRKMKMLNQGKLANTDKNPTDTTPTKRKPLESHCYDSPCLKTVPSNIVKNMVRNIEATPVSKHVKFFLENNQQQTRTPTSIRSDLIQSTASKKNFYMGISTEHKEEVAPEDFSVTVAVRVRPFNKKEEDAETKQVVFMDDCETIVADGSGKHAFTYDFCFDSTGLPGSQLTTQIEVYEKLARPLLSAAFGGYNTCLFAYGQTGSGKSYTVMGSGQSQGVIPRFCDEMFGGAQSIMSNDESVRFHIEMSYFEIYNEKIHDLLVSSDVLYEGEKRKKSLRVREHPEKGPFVEGLSTFVVTSLDDVYSWLDVGNRQRVTASTGMNDCSSRSHAVFLLNMTKTTVVVLEGEQHESSRCSRINLVDLAGSERSSTAQTTGQRLKEGSHINKSLLTLGKVISMLSQKSKASIKGRSRIFVPYRESALTWLLKESLGGNSRTAMIATVSPASSNIEETMSTLRYAAQARTIVNTAKVNEDPNAVIIRELKAEIAKLREARQSETLNKQAYQNTMKEVAFLKEKLAKADKDKTEVGETWKKRLQETESKKAEEIAELKRAGVSFKVDNKLPNLVNLNEDPQLSELLLYVIRHGTTRIGRKGGPFDCEIQLSGALICDVHCKLINENEVVKIEPSRPDAKIFINGSIINGMTELHHGDRVVIGGDHFFRLNHPIEVQLKKKLPGCEEVKKDFEFAKKELIIAQSARMEKEIEEARLHERQKMLKEIELAKKDAEIELANQKKQFENMVKSLKNQIDGDRLKRNEMEAIKEENLALHQQVETNRKIHEMANQIQTQKYLEEKNSVFKNVFSELEAESKKLSSEINRLEKNLQKRRESPGWIRMPPESDDWAPLRISIMIEEANRISKTMNKDTVFSRFETDFGPAQVKVENTRLHICTLWSMGKFENKLEGMREAFNKYSSNSADSSDSCDNLFYDPTDDWSEVVCATEGEEQREINSNTSRDTPTSSRSRRSKRKSRRISSIALTQSSPALQQSILQYECSQNQAPSWKRESVKSMCKNLLVTDEAFRSHESTPSMIDQFLYELNEFANCCENLVEKFSEQTNVSSGNEYEKLSDQHALRATLHLHACVTMVTTLHDAASTLNQSRSLRLVKRISDAMEKMKGEMAKLLQGVEEEIERIVDESSGKIRLHTANVAKYTGALCPTLKCDVNSFDEQKQHALSFRIKNAFVQGADSLLRQTISTGLSSISERWHRDGGVQSKAVKSSIDLLECCKELQDFIDGTLVREALNRTVCEETQNLHNASLVIRENDLSPTYHESYLKRTRCMVEYISELTDIMSNSTDDQLGNTASLRRIAKKIATLPLPNDIATMSSNEGSMLNNCSYLQEYSDLQCEIEKRHQAIREAANILMDAVS